MAQDNTAESLYWAREVLKVDADNTDAHYVLAAEDLETRSPNVPEVKRHLKVLDDHNAPAIRRALVRAKLAQATGDDRGRDEALHEGRSASLAPGADMIDRIARVRLEALDIQCQVQIQSQSETARLGDRVKTLLAHVKELTAIPDIDPGQVTRLSQVLEQTQRTLAARSSKGKKTGDRAIELAGRCDRDRSRGDLSAGPALQSESRSPALSDLCRSSSVPAAARSLLAGYRRGAAPAGGVEARQSKHGHGASCRGSGDGALQAR